MKSLCTHMLCLKVWNIVGGSTSVKLFLSITLIYKVCLLLWTVHLEYFFTFYWQKQPGKEMLEKLTSSYEHIYNLPLDEDILYEKCQTAVKFVDKLERDYANNSIQGK